VPAVRVASYNISGGITADSRFYSKRGSATADARIARATRTLEGVARLLESAQIEIAALQEVDTCFSGAQTLDQGHFLANRLSAEHVTFPLFEYDLGRFANVRTGLATISSVPLLRQLRVSLPQERVTWQRKLKAKLLGAKGAMHTIHEVEGQQLHVVNAHLTHDVDAQKEFEFQALLDYCSQLDPLVLLGDLNTSPTHTRNAGMVEEHYFGSDGCMKILRAHMQKYPGKVHLDARMHSAKEVQEVCTYPAGRESIKLDYCIGFSSKNSFELSPETILGSPLSNHSATSVLVSW
jgi:endonuclease/exonuclease/phosphatase family metal-dependent hydrolase